MAKAILEFDLTDRDDRMEHMRALKALDMALVLHQIAYNTKKGIENEIEFNKLDAYDAVDKVFQRFWDEMNEHGINLDELIC
jgi:hypothetical protein